MKKEIFCETCNNVTTHTVTTAPGFITRYRTIKNFIYECTECQTVKKDSEEVKNENVQIWD